MVTAAVEVDPRMIAFVLPSIPESVGTARFHVRATLGFHGLDNYADDAGIITSELVTNAVQHAPGGGAETIKVVVARTSNPPTVTLIVSDSSPAVPRRCDLPADEEQGRGLHIVEALSAYWGWHPQDGGKAVFAVLAVETSPVLAEMALHGIGADRSSQAVELARILLRKIESGEYSHGATLSLADLAREYQVPTWVISSALAMLAAIRYVSRPGLVDSYSVIWQAEA